MASLSELINFILNLFVNEDARAAFDANPKAALDDAGLNGVTAQDVRDARLELADSGAVTPNGSGSTGRSDDAVGELRSTTSGFHHVPAAAPPVPPPAPQFIDRTITIDDRDTFIFQDNDTTNNVSDDDVTVINDSFNDESTTDVVAINDESVTNNVDIDNVTTGDADIDAADIDGADIDGADIDGGLDPDAATLPPSAVNPDPTTDVSESGTPETPASDTAVLTEDEPEPDQGTDTSTEVEADPDPDPGLAFDTVDEDVDIDPAPDAVVV